VEAVLAQVEKLAKRTNCIFVKIDPDVDEASSDGTRLRHTLRQRGWRFSQDQIQFKNTASSDLQPDEETLLEGMKSKWRYNIRLAERRGIKVRLGGPADLPAFYVLYQDTGQRDGFLIRPFAYYQTTWESYLAAEQEEKNPAGGALLLAEHDEEEKPVAGIFVMRYGERAWYFYGASSERRRRDMPNYLLQWEAMRWARARGCTVYDWWGAPAEINDLNDPLQGVWQFKQGFGATFESHIGAWDYATWPWLYRLYTEVMPRVMAAVRRWRGIGHSATTQAGQA
jgi:lipid II:glycine glycyltransferase (peptidoglycan interpeptide bridge formation enzyme)